MTAIVLFGLVVIKPVVAFELLTQEEIATVRNQQAPLSRRPPHMGRQKAKGKAEGERQPPRIYVKQPSPLVGVNNPFDIEVEFIPQGDATINPETLKIKYGMFDITKRVLSSGQAEVSNNGIKVRRAEIQSGTYDFIISIEDDQGQVGHREVRLEIL